MWLHAILRALARFLRRGCRVARTRPAWAVAGPAVGRPRNMLPGYMRPFGTGITGHSNAATTPSSTAVPMANAWPSSASESM